MRQLTTSNHDRSLTWCLITGAVLLLAAFVLPSCTSMVGTITVVQKSTGSAAAYVAPAGSASLQGARALDGSICICVIDGDRLVFSPIDPRDLRDSIIKAYEKEIGGKPTPSTGERK